MQIAARCSAAILGSLLALAAGHCPAGESPASTTFGWRGDGTGRYPEAEPPTEWDIDNGTNVLWQTEVGKGQSSPVVVGRRIFVTAEPDVLLCLARDSGKVLWRRNNGYDALSHEQTPSPGKRPRTHKDCGYSSATPVADKSSVFASFGTGVVVCYDHGGRRRWIRYLDRKVVPDYGRTASPLLAGRKLLVSLGGLSALDPQTGETLWETPQAKPSYGTPAIARIAEVDVAITPNGDCVRVGDGRILATKMGQLEYPSPLVHGRVVYFVGQPAVALKLPERLADRFQPEKLWETDELEGEFYASPVYHEGVLYCVSNEGVLYALDARSGKIVFRKELKIGSAGGMPGIEPANIYGSLTLAGNVMLLTNDIGETLVLAPDRQYRERSHNYLDKGTGASPVADGKLLLLRGGGKLYGLGRR